MSGIIVSVRAKGLDYCTAIRDIIPDNSCQTGKIKICNARIKRDSHVSIDELTDAHLDELNQNHSEFAIIVGKTYDMETKSYLSDLAQIWGAGTGGLFNLLYRQQEDPAKMIEINVQTILELARANSERGGFKDDPQAKKQEGFQVYNEQIEFNEMNKVPIIFNGNDGMLYVARLPAGYQGRFLDFLA